MKGQAINSSDISQPHEIRIRNTVSRQMYYDVTAVYILSKRFGASDTVRARYICHVHTTSSNY